MARPLVTFLPDAQARPYWDDLYRMLEPAAAVSDSEVLEKNDLVWVAVDGNEVIGAVTTRWIEHGNTEVKHIAGIRMKEWFHDLEEMICNWSKACGAKKITAQGRKGWMRVNHTCGWKVTGMENGLILYEKSL